MIKACLSVEHRLAMQTAVQILVLLKVGTIYHNFLNPGLNSSPVPNIVYNC